MFPRKFNRRISELKKKRKSEKETSGWYKSVTRRFSLFFFFSMRKLDTKKGEGGKLRLPGKRAIYSVKSAGWDAQSWAWVEVCPCKWPWFRSGVANLPANEQQRNLEGSSTGEKQRVSSKEWFRGRRIDPPWMEKEELPYYLHLNSQHREISFRIIYNSWKFYAFWNLKIIINY